MDIVVIIGVVATVIGTVAVIFFRQRSHRASGSSVVAPDNKGTISTSGDTTTSGDATTVHAGGDVTGPVTTGDRGTSVRGDFGGQLVVAESGAVVNMYVAQLPESAPSGLKDAFGEARELQLSGDHESAVKKAYTLFSSVVDEVERYAVHRLLADSYLELEKLIEAEGQYREAIRYAEQSSIDKARADSLTNLGYLLSERGHFRADVEVTSKAVELYGGLGDLANAAALKGNLGLSYTRMASYAKAESLFRDAASEFAKVGSPISQARQMDNLGLLLASRERVDEAAELQRDALQLVRSAPKRDDSNESAILGNLALSLARSENPQNLEEAEERLGQAIDLDTRNGDDSMRAHHLSNLGVVKDHQGKQAEAKKSHEEALTVYRSLGRRNGQIHELRHLGMLVQDGKEWAPAREYFNQAIEISRSVGYDFDLCIDLISLARVQVKSGDFDGAKKSLGEACALAAQCGLEEKEAQARQMLAQLTDD